MLAFVSTMPASLQRLAISVDGWLDLGAPERALLDMDPLLSHPASRPLGLALRVRALVELKRHAEALSDIEEIKRGEHDENAIDLQEAWCRKRLGDVRGAAACMERLVARERKSAIGHYNLACYLALAGETERSLEELAIACGLDPALRESLMTEHDLDSLHGDERFEQLRPPKK